MAEEVRRKISVGGVVQGVGFRPFVFNLAKSLGLSGHVLNNSTGVLIEVQGEPEVVEKFVAKIASEAPPLSKISSVEYFHMPTVKSEGFLILESATDEEGLAPVSPDMDVCDDCLGEMRNPADRRYRYPFINCTNCGPRHTIVRRTPYDRPFTTMSEYAMCPECEREYRDPSNRRFHAQPNACPVCGPSLSIYDSKWEKIVSADPVLTVAKMLCDGAIAAIKGVGGFHLACEALDGGAVERLRQRKTRKEKPLALMVASVADAREFTEIDEHEERLLSSREKPIVLLKAKKTLSGIAPGLREYGVFLPYAPVHHLLFSSGSPRALVMTSANLSDEPIVYEAEELRERLGGIADIHLTHDRPIAWRCDDSVVRVVRGETAFIRRSRGYVPLPLKAGMGLQDTLACGGDLKNVFCIAKGNVVIPGPHIGDLVNAGAFGSFRDSIEHFKSIFRVEPKLVAVDMHPGYHSSNHGRSLGLPVVEVQHHHAHIAGVMAENGLTGRAIGVALDGTGYGTDGRIWGGEILACSYSSFERLGHFPPLKLPGGDAAAKEPWRTAVAIMHSVFGDDVIAGSFAREIGMKKVEGVVSMINSDVNCPVSTSAGRWFDAVGSMIGAGHFNLFEGRIPMIMESLAYEAEEGEFEFQEAGDGTVSFDGMTMDICRMKEAGTETGKISAMFHNTLARVVLRLCVRAGNKTGLGEVCLGGGVFQNQLLTGKVFGLLEKSGFKVFLPKLLPINDGGLSFGQAVVASAKDGGV